MFTVEEVVQLGKLFVLFGEKSDQELQLLHAALSINPLPSQLADLAPFQAKALHAVNFLLGVEAHVLQLKSICGVS